MLRGRAVEVTFEQQDERVAAFVTAVEGDTSGEGRRRSEVDVEAAVTDPLVLIFCARQQSLNLFRSGGGDVADVVRVVDVRHIAIPNECRALGLKPLAAEGEVGRVNFKRLDNEVSHRLPRIAGSSRWISRP